MAVTELISIPKQQPKGLTGLQKDVFWCKRSELATIPGTITSATEYGDDVTLDGDVTFATGGYWKRMGVEHMGSSLVKSREGEGKRVVSVNTLTSFFSDWTPTVEGFEQNVKGEDLCFLIPDNCSGGRYIFLGSTCDQTDVRLIAEGDSKNEESAKDSTLTFQNKGEIRYYTGTVSETPAV